MVLIKMFKVEIEVYMEIRIKIKNKKLFHNYCYNI